MKPHRAVLITALTLAIPAGAQPVPDHLECYKIKDPAPHVSYTADLGGLAAEPGCTIRVPAKMVCVPATKAGVTPTPPEGGGTGTPNAYGCYKIKCPRTTLPTIPLDDQFGSRSVTPSAAKLLCAPLEESATTTTTSSTTTTTLRFVDNGNGTVTDNYTGLQWEKKDGAGGFMDFDNPHDVHNLYTWSSSATATAADGTAFTDFLSRLNACTSADGSTVTAAFAGHCDWRLPTITELQTIVDCSFGNPCIDPVFGPTTDFLPYWSSTTFAGDPLFAWQMFQSDGFALPSCKDPLSCDFLFGGFPIRAVRGGL